MKNSELEILWIQGQIEMKFEKHAKYALENNPMKGTPFEGMLIHNALSKLSNELISGLEEKKDKLRLDSEEIEKLVDDAYKTVYLKMFDE